jgi:Fic family protein
VARIVTELALAQDDQMAMRVYSLSSQIMKVRQDYYSVLERTQKNGGDITDWLEWFLSCVESAVVEAEVVLGHVIQKSVFWAQFKHVPLTDRQRKVVNRLLDVHFGEFEGGLTTRKYSGMTKSSRATAYREIVDLVEKGLLVSNSGLGRNVSYRLCVMS